MTLTHNAHGPTSHQQMNGRAEQIEYIYICILRMKANPRQTKNIEISIYLATELIIGFFSAHKIHTNHLTEITINSRFEYIVNIL